jgi:hypothetical protein
MQRERHSLMEFSTAVLIERLARTHARREL